MTVFGDLLRQHISRKHGLSQNKLAMGIFVDPSVISRMCNGERLNGNQSRERVLNIISWFHSEGVLTYIEEANALLDSCRMPLLKGDNTQDAQILEKLQSQQENLQPDSRIYLKQMIEAEISIPFWGLGVMFFVFATLLVNIVSYILLFRTMRITAVWVNEKDSPEDINRWR